MGGGRDVPCECLGPVELVAVGFMPPKGMPKAPFGCPRLAGWAQPLSVIETAVEMSMDGCTHGERGLAGAQGAGANMRISRVLERRAMLGAGQRN